jgi:hypothetical protein
MTRFKPQNFAITIFLALLLSACGSQINVDPTAISTETAVPTLTNTPTATSAPTITPSPTATIIPSATSIPPPVSLAGSISLSGDSVKSYASTVELREKETFNLIQGVVTDSSGKYKLDDIQPGKYELWVLITKKPAVPSGCTDIQPPDLSWLIGIAFEDDKALTMENAYLTKALLLNEGLQGSGLKAVGFYAVLSGFEVKPGAENQFDVVLICS